MSSSSSDKDELKPATKKRGRKPKGGKIIQQISSNETQKEDKPNVIQKAKTDKKVKTFLKSNDHTSKPLPAQLIRRSLPRKAKNK